MKIFSTNLAKNGTDAIPYPDAEVFLEAHVRGWSGAVEALRGICLPKT